MRNDWERSSVALLRDAREAAGLNQATLAQRAGVSAGALASYETGRRPLTLERLEQLLAACGLRARTVVEMIIDEQERLVAAFDGTTVQQRTPRSCQWLIHRLSEFDVRWGGTFAACLQGVPVLPRWPTLAVTKAELPGLERVVRGSQWWWGDLDTARLRLEGRLLGEDSYGMWRAEVVLLPRDVRERHVATAYGNRLRLVAVEDLSAVDADPELVARVLRAGGLDCAELQPPAPITGASSPARSAW